MSNPTQNENDQLGEVFNVNEIDQLGEVFNVQFKLYTKLNQILALHLGTDSRVKEFSLVYKSSQI